tara:strand:+ start:611 stop:928 length:318 start_codon:yes stop_codon:yes gene_type:complete
MRFDFKTFLTTLPSNITKKCKGFQYLEDPSIIIPGGYIRYFSKEDVPIFKMGGKIIRKTNMYLELENRKKTYYIYINKFYILYKPPTIKKSKRYLRFKAILNSIE